MVDMADGWSREPGADREKFPHPAQPMDAPRTLKLTPASSIKPRPTYWTWDGRIPRGAVTLVPGREGIGKSLFMSWLIASMTTGTLPGVHHGMPKPVFYATTEDSWERTVVPRLIAAGADLEFVWRVEAVEDETVHPLTVPADIAALKEEITRAGAGLLALDPLLSVIDASINDYKSRELRTALEPLSAIADDTGCSVVGLAHFNKAANSDALQRVSGSAAFTQVIRAAIGMAADPDSEDGTCVLSQIKNNLGKSDLPSLSYIVESATVETEEGAASVGRLRFTGETERGVSDILAESGSPEERSECGEAEAWLTAHLADAGGSAPAGDVLKAATRDGVSKTTLHRARKRRKITSGKDGMGGPWVWSLPEDSPKVPKIPVPVRKESSESSVEPSDGSASLNFLEEGTREARQPRTVTELAARGPCARCGQSTRRYGPGGNPVCQTCRDDTWPSGSVGAEQNGERP